MYTWTRRYRSCCFSCKDQPICAVCTTPCNPTFDRIEVIPGVLPTTPADIQALTYSYSAQTLAVNQGSNAQSITVTFSMTQTLTATMQYTEAFQYSEKASFKVRACLQHLVGDDLLCVVVTHGSVIYAACCTIKQTQCINTTKSPHSRSELISLTRNSIPGAHKLSQSIHSPFLTGWHTAAECRQPGIWLATDLYHQYYQH
jgi:hypothetical protein